jgi:hypothetical protein
LPIVLRERLANAPRLPGRGPTAPTGEGRRAMYFCELSLPDTSIFIIDLQRSRTDVMISTRPFVM